jgi:hypothetical protein
MEKSPIWKANSHSASQKIRFLWNRKVHYRVQSFKELLRKLNENITIASKFDQWEVCVCV